MFMDLNIDYWSYFLLMDESLDDFNHSKPQEFYTYPLVAEEKDKTLKTGADNIDPDQDLFVNYEPYSDKSMFGAFQILLNTAIGSGALMVPYIYQCGVINALLIGILFGFVAYMSQYYMIDAAHFSSEYDYRGLFGHCFGPKWVWIVNSMIAIVQTGTAIIYARWNGQLINHIIGSRHYLLGSDTFYIFVVTTLVVFPLTLFRHIGQLDKVALLSTGFIILLIVHALYWFIIKCQEEGFDPEHKLVIFEINDKMITACSVNAMAFNCHINLFSTLTHLENCTIRRARKLSLITLATAFSLYNIFGIITYFTLFKITKEKSILQLYTENTFTEITIAGVVFILIVSTPLVLWGGRNGALNIIYKDKEITPLQWVITGGIFCLIAATLASSSDNIVIFFDLAGGIFTPLIIFLFPALFYLKTQVNQLWWKKLGAIVISIFTIISSAACLYQTVVEIIHEINEK